MESLVPSDVTQHLKEFLGIALKDPKAELECKLLAGDKENRINTKDVADRMLEAIEKITVGPPEEHHYLRIAYPDNVRVEVETPQMIHKVCVTDSFKNIPLKVERKTLYYHNQRELSKKDTIEIPDLFTKFTLRHEEFLRKDWDASPNDKEVQAIRILSRKSFKTADQLFQIDFSMVKFFVRSKAEQRMPRLRDVLKRQPSYELEIELINKKTQAKPEDIAKALLRNIESLLQAFQQTPFLLTKSDQERYSEEYTRSRLSFYDIVTLARRNLKETLSHNILQGYTVTNKADGIGMGLFVTADRKLLLVDRQKRVKWTGIRAMDDSHKGDFVLGEYIPEKNLFAIFDIVRQKGKAVNQLPLMRTDEELTKHPEASRLGCAKMFVSDLQKEFISLPTPNPIRIETKLFYSGDGPVMQEAIRKLLDTKQEYETDGLIFTPRMSPIAPRDESDGNRWLRAQKWKPPHQNSVDFLVRFTETVGVDPILKKTAQKADLQVGLNPGFYVISPCETLTGEQVPAKLPEDFERLTERNPTRIPALFQPSLPRDTNAHTIYIPLDERKIPVDETGQRIEDNTIVECYYEIETRRWKPMRTRQDKTFKQRVLGMPEQGNDVRTADNVWTSIHIPITEEMIRNLTDYTADDSMEDDLQYRSDQKRENRVLKQAYAFNTTVVKNDLYKRFTHEGQTLLELASGRGGDMPRWQANKIGKVVGIEQAANNLISQDGACSRAIKAKREYPRDHHPSYLFIVGDITQPIWESDNQQIKILKGEEKPRTRYLEQFEGLKKFDGVACQFAIHQACETEETFRVFAKNVADTCKDTFFGTCLDGQAVYSLLLGKPNHLFSDGTNVGGEFKKEQDDQAQWSESFGMPIQVLLESFETEQREYLTPFGKITEIMKEFGFELVESKMFSEQYTNQSRINLTPAEQSFSFLNRTFVFKRTEVKEEVKQVVPEDTAVEEKEEKPKRKLKKVKTEEKEKPVLFFNAGEDKGEFQAFSNEAPYAIEIEGVRYPTVEHQQQAMKAKTFEDKEMEEKIQATPSAKAVKTLGKKVKNFAEEVWNDKRQEVMLRGVKAKFAQHPELQTKLKETGSRPIGYANPRNTFWGIGTSMGLEKAQDPDKWRGQNKLGKILIALRDDFRE